LGNIELSNTKILAHVYNSAIEIGLEEFVIGRW